MTDGDNQRPERVARSGFLLIKPLRERDFRLLWIGRTVSLLGDGIFTVAIVWQTLEISSAPVALGVVTLGRTLPRVVTILFAGAFGDRIGRKPILVTSESIQAVSVGVIALLATMGILELWHLVALEAVAGAAQGFFLPNSTAIIPELLPKDLLIQGNALDASSRLLTQNFVGPALGGVLIATIGTEGAFALDALTFLVGAGCVALIKLLPPPKSETSLRDDMREGFRYTRSQRWLWVTLLAAGIWNFCNTGSWLVLVPLHLTEDLGASAGQLGLGFAAFGLGGGLAALLSSQLAPPRRRILAAYVLWGSGSLALIGIGWSDTITLVYAFTFYAGFALEYGNVLWTALMQDLVPSNMLGRASSVDWFISLSLQPIGLAIVGPIAATVGVAATLVGAGVLQFVTAVGGVMMPGVRDPDKDPTNPG